MKEVKQVSPVLVALDTTSGFDMIYGIDYASFDSLGRGFRFIRGARPSGSNALLIDDFKSRSRDLDVGSHIRLRISLNIIICLAAFISFLVILMTMYTSVLERVTEIGVRRVVGARRGDIMRQIVWETVALTLLGFTAGIAMTYLVKAGLFVAKPTFSILVHAGGLLKTALIALVSSLLGAAYPAYRASRLDPARAVAYE